MAAGRIESIFLHSGRAEGEPMRAVGSAEVVVAGGLVGDRYFGTSVVAGREDAGREVTLIEAEAIEAVLGRPLARPGPAGLPDSPGQLASHYAPAAALRLDARDAGPDETLIGFGPGPAGLNLSPSGDLAEAAARLFETLRAADRLGRPIAVAPVPRHGLGLATKVRNIATVQALHPDREVVHTWNAASNTHMIAVNEAMGFRVVSESAEYVRRLSA